MRFDLLNIENLHKWQIVKYKTYFFNRFLKHWISFLLDFLYKFVKKPQLVNKVKKYAK
jgi:hypothetical protein